MPAREPAPAVRPEQSGLTCLRQHFERSHLSPMMELFGIRLVTAEEGAVEIAVVPQTKFNNPQGRMHGGFAATVIDTALGCAVLSKMERPVGYGTIELKVNYVGKIDEETGELWCRAQVLHAGRTMFTVEAKLVDTAGKLYAHGSGTFLVYPS